MTEMLFGAIAAASLVAGLIFLRYWYATRDRFFILFALSFWVETANRVHMVVSGSWREDSAAAYVIRLIAYGLILIAIWDKNRPRPK
jgi:hypothetical protein